MPAINAVFATQCFLVLEQQAFMAGVEIDFLELLVRIRIDANRFHERNGAFNVFGQFGVLLLFMLPREVEVPTMDLGQVGKPAAGQTAHEIEAARALMIGV